MLPLDVAYSSFMDNNELALALGNFIIIIIDLCGRTFTKHLLYV
jgi:hypothetical protein